MITMGNLLRDMFDPNSEYSKRINERIEQIAKERKENHCCEYCIHSEQQPHIEMGRESGTDSYCKIHKELRLEYYNTCILFEEKDKEK